MDQEHRSYIIPMGDRLVFQLIVWSSALVANKRFEGRHPRSAASLARPKERAAKRKRDRNRVVV
jgi:hypothetical protein